MAQLPTVPFGTTDMSITRVGFGAWAIGGADWAFGWGKQDDDDSVAAIRHSVESGINWIDTAAVYGLGHSEEVVGRAIADIPEGERPFIFTKCGTIDDPDNPGKTTKRIATPESIRREIEDSLRRLGVEVIDLYQVHWPPADGSPVETYWPTMLELKAEGKVRAVGLSNHKVDQLEAAEKIGHVDTLQPPFSAINRDAGAAEIAWCADHGTGVIAYSPMQSGLLSGRFTRERAANLPADDWRSRNPEFTERLDANLALADALRPIADRHGVIVAAVAIGWVLAWRGATAAIVGARRPEQIDGWLPAATLALTDADLDEIAAAIRATGAGHGPDHP